MVAPLPNGTLVQIAGAGHLANMEQAQRRIDMLRTTETASKDRIAAARKELESALARLESEPAPGLPAGTEDLVLEEAQQVFPDTELAKEGLMIDLRKIPV